MQKFSWTDSDVIKDLVYGRCGKMYEATFQEEKIALKLGNIGMAAPGIGRGNALRSRD